MASQNTNTVMYLVPVYFVRGEEVLHPRMILGCGRGSEGKEVVWDGLLFW